MQPPVDSVCFKNCNKHVDPCRGCWRHAVYRAVSEAAARVPGELTSKMRATLATAAAQCGNLPSRGQAPLENSSVLLDLPRTAGMSPSGADGSPMAPHSEEQVLDQPLGQLLNQSGHTLSSDRVGSSPVAERETDEITAASDGDGTSRNATRLPRERNVSEKSSDLLDPPRTTGRSP